MNDWCYPGTLFRLLVLGMWVGLPGYGGKRCRYSALRLTMDMDFAVFAELPMLSMIAWSICR